MVRFWIQFRQVIRNSLQPRRWDPETLSYRRLPLWRGILRLTAWIFPPFAGGVGITLLILSWLWKENPHVQALQHQIRQQQEELLLLQRKIHVLEQQMDSLQQIQTEVHWVMVGWSPDSIPGVTSPATGGSYYTSVEESSWLLSPLPGSWKQMVNYLQQKLHQLETRLQEQKQVYPELIEAFRMQQERLRHIPSIQPVSNRMLIRIASGFGYRRDPFYGIYKMHEGVDFSCPRGTPVYATADGVVEKVKFSRRGYGIHIIINHGYGYKTLYAHLSRVYVREGEKVVRGQKIGAVGSTGKSTAPHLHYEVWYHGKKLNPIYFFTADLTDEEYEKIVRLAEQTRTSMD